MSTLEQFIRFETDIVGLERTLRMVHALLQICVSYPAVAGLFLFAASLGAQPAWAAPTPGAQAAFAALRGNVAMARRWFRLFRFVDSFHGAYKLYASLSSSSSSAAPAAAVAAGPEAEKGAQGGGEEGEKARGRGGGGPGFQAEVWLDVLSRSFMGMYLLLETATLPDALGIPGLRPWGDLAAPLFVESQRLWFLALGCGALSGAVKLGKGLAHAPVPPTGEGYGTGEAAKGAAAGEGEDGDGDGDEKAQWRRERERLRAAVMAGRERRAAWRREARARSRALLRKMAADLLDMAIPGAVVGWVRVQGGTVGIIMVVTTYLTGKDAWERCGREVGKA